MDNKSAEAWSRAIDICGGPYLVNRKTGIDITRISRIKHGGCQPTPEQALKLSLLTNLQVEPEELLPDYDFEYVLEYAMMRMRKDDIKFLNQ